MDDRCTVLSWFQEFNKGMKTRKSCKVLLLVDNCSAHGNIATLPDLSHVEVHFLPPNITSRFQPLDAGIIAAVKMGYKKRHLERALNLADMDAKDIYKIDIMTAMKWFNVVWGETKGLVIQNCWRTMGILAVLEPLQEDRMEATCSVTEVEHVIDELWPWLCRRRGRFPFRCFWTMKKT